MSQTLPPKPLPTAIPLRLRHPAPSALAVAGDIEHTREVARATACLFAVLNAGVFEAEVASAGRGGQAPVESAKAAAAALQSAAARAAAAAVRQTALAAKQAELLLEQAAATEEAKRSAVAHRVARTAAARCRGGAWEGSSELSRRWKT